VRVNVRHALAWTDARQTLARVNAVWRRAVLMWLPVAVAATGVCGLVYGAVQQDLRQGANDPQIQMAEDAARRLDAGESPVGVVPAESIEMSESLRPYVMVFDGSSRLMASSVTLHGGPPPFPPSVFDRMSAPFGQDRITWQPEVGIRSAVVVQAWRDGYVVAGRSLRLVEERVDRLVQLTGFVWALTLGATAVAALFAALLL
jgi:hypothetical protein